ncbi:hypothetical protein ABZW30_12620 [Kitasatospora sp. NPDC004669]|uniref:hypothetical protein n=1 Tax=Kitasatospora sp. NPDC004669 TaxID=3154555 RepID=UPI0033A00D9D
MSGIDELRNYSPEETADILSCKVGALLDNLDRYPHQKIGRSVAFDQQDIAAIKELCRVQPKPVTVEPIPSLAAIKPRGRRRAA